MICAYYRLNKMKLLHLLFVTVTGKVRECYLSPNKFHTDLTKKA